MRKLLLGGMQKRLPNLPITFQTPLKILQLAFRSLQRRFKGLLQRPNLAGFAAHLERRTANQI